MNKDSIEILRQKSPLNYGLVNPPYTDSQETLDKLIEWSRKPDNLNKKIYKHRLSSSYENISKDDFYKFRSSDCPSCDIPYCELVYYLDIYWQ